MKKIPGLAPKKKKTKGPVHVRTVHANVKVKKKKKKEKGPLCVVGEKTVLPP